MILYYLKHMVNKSDLKQNIYSAFAIYDQCTMYTMPNNHYIIITNYPWKQHEHFEYWCRLSAIYLISLKKEHGTQKGQEFGMGSPAFSLQIVWTGCLDKNIISIQTVSMINWNLWKMIDYLVFYILFYILTCFLHIHSGFLNIFV